jgi:hypothetical protein
MCFALLMPPKRPPRFDLHQAACGVFAGIAGMKIQRGKQGLKSLGSVADSQGRPAARIEVLELKRKSAGKVRG